MHSKKQKDDIAASNHLFDDCWKAKKYQDAIRLYNKMGRPFWNTEKVARYYARRGEVSKAIREYEFLLREYAKMPINPFPFDLFMLGKLYVTKDSRKARRYLNQSISSTQEDRRFTKWHKERARALLERM